MAYQILTVIRRKNCYYVDKTRFIENIEDSPPYLFFIRPRRFGKSLFLSLMECYYDIKRKDDFEEIFSGTYIYDNPTEERNKYLILYFRRILKNRCPITASLADSLQGRIRLCLKSAKV